MAARRDYNIVIKKSGKFKNKIVPKIVKLLCVIKDMICGSTTSQQQKSPSLYSANDFPSINGQKK